MRRATVFLISLLIPFAAQATPERWRGEWPRTDFSRHSVPYEEIFGGGPPKDGIPPIDDPRFVSAEEAARRYAAREPVISIRLGGEAKAYPKSVLIWHEIANDTVGGVPVAVTWCPLCDSAVVFDRRLDGRVLDFGTTGKLRHSDLVMYDRQTESWWQQFLGRAVVGELTGSELKMLPARIESFARFAERHPDGKVLVPSEPDLRPYGGNPYAGYDSAAFPFLFRGEGPEGMAPLERVVAVEDAAWSLDLLKSRGRIEAGDLVLAWEPGLASAVDTRDIAEGREVGQVTVQRRTAAGLADAVHDVTFAFAFHAFRPEAPIFVACESGKEQKPPLYCHPG